MDPLKVAVVGLGFWARFQVRAWRELERQGLVQLAAVCGRTREEVNRFAAELDAPDIVLFTEVEAMLRQVPGLGVVDLITTTPTHYELTKRVLAHRIPVIVQKPMAQTLSHAIEMVRTAREAGVPLLVHENFRWQKPFLTLKQIIANDGDRLGPLIDIRAEWESGGEDFLRGQPYFADQPVLVNGEVGVHLVDVLRFLSTRDVVRVTSVQMHTGVDRRYRGEDVAHVMLDMQGGVSAAYRVAFSAAHRDERPPQTFVRMTFEKGAIELAADYEITVTYLDRRPGGGIAKEVSTLRATPDAAEWTKHPSLRDYQSWLGQWESCLATNRSCAEFVMGNRAVAGAITTGEDNLNVLAAMFGAYLGFKSGTRVEIPESMRGLDALGGRLDAARIGYPDYPGGY